MRMIALGSMLVREVLMCALPACAAPVAATRLPSPMEAWRLRPEDAPGTQPPRLTHARMHMIGACQVALSHMRGGAHLEGLTTALHTASSLHGRRFRRQRALRVPSTGEVESSSDPCSLVCAVVLRTCPWTRACAACALCACLIHRKRTSCSCPKMAGGSCSRPNEWT